MPILLDLSRHNILGPTYRRGPNKGLNKGLRKGRREGLEAGEGRLVARILAQRFGVPPVPISERFESMTSSEIEQVSGRLFEATTLEEHKNRG